MIPRKRSPYYYRRLQRNREESIRAALADAGLAPAPKAKPSAKAESERSGGEIGLPWSFRDENQDRVRRLRR